MKTKIIIIKIRNKKMSNLFTKRTTEFLDELDLLDTFFKNTTTSWTDSRKEYIEIDGNEFKIHLLAIGLSKDEIDINIDGTLLTIQSNVDLTKRVPIVDNLNWKRGVNSEYDLNDISAKLENGILTLVFKKKEKKKNIKSVTIK